jgi:hypothetical protein
MSIKLQYTSNVHVIIFSWDYLTTDKSVVITTLQHFFFQIKTDTFTCLLRDDLLSTRITNDQLWHDIWNPNLTFLQSLNISKWQSEAINEEGQTIQWSKQRPKIEIMFIKTQKSRDWVTETPLTTHDIPGWSFTTRVPCHFTFLMCVFNTWELYKNKQLPIKVCTPLQLCGGRQFICGCNYSTSWTNECHHKC